MTYSRFRSMLNFWSKVKAYTINKVVKRGFYKKELVSFIYYIFKMKKTFKTVCD